MRIALVSSYSWTYPGGVTRHIEALAEQYLAAGHDVRVLSPVDPDDRLTLRLHHGARPAQRPLPEYLVPLGRTVGFPSNGAVSNVAYGVSTVVARVRLLEHKFPRPFARPAVAISGEVTLACVVDADAATVSITAADELGRNDYGIELVVRELSRLAPPACVDLS